MPLLRLLLFLFLLFCISAVFQLEIPSLLTEKEEKSIQHQHQQGLKSQSSNQQNQDSSLILQLPTKKIDPLHVKIALSKLGITEQPIGSNWGKDVEEILAAVRIYFKAPWCGGFVGDVLMEGKAGPNALSGRAKAYAVKGYSYQLSDVLYGNYTPKSGDVRVKSRKGGGHVDIFVSWDRKKEEGYVIGGNVGDKVAIRKVTLKSMIADRTTHIVDIKGIYYY